MGNMAFNFGAIHLFRDSTFFMNVKSKKNARRGDEEKTSMFATTSVIGPLRPLGTLGAVMMLGTLGAAAAR